MRRLALAIVATIALASISSVASWAQTPDPNAPTTPPPTSPYPPAPAPPPPPPPPPPAPKRWFFGGGFGATFGNVDSVSVSPLLGLHLTPRIDVGTQVYYRWIDDGRYEPSVSTDDYGASVFARCRVFQRLFVEADVEYANYEFIRLDGSTDRNSDTRFLAGGGYYIPVGRATSMYASVLYDFGYNDDDPFEPYDDPWRVQFGVTVGF